MKRLLALCCAALALSSTPAAATPPDMIEISDQLFAMSDQTVFVLRSSVDNLGVYFSSYRETWLVGIDVATGEETMWLVWRGRRDTRFGNDAADEWAEITTFDREQWHDPMQVIADADAELVLGLGRGVRDDAQLEPDAAGRFTVAMDFAPTFSWQRSVSIEHARTSVESLASRVAEAERMAPITTHELFAMREVEWDSCTFNQHGYPHGTGERAYLLVRLDCESMETGERTRLIQVVSPS